MISCFVFRPKILTVTYGKSTSENSSKPNFKHHNLILYRLMFVTLRVEITFSASILYSNILNSELGIKQNISKVTRNIPIFQQMGNTFPEELKSQRYFVLNLEMTTGL